MRLGRLLALGRKFFFLARENSISDVVRYLIRRQAGSKDPLLLTFSGYGIHIRPNTPYLDVAYSCFCGEFDIIGQYAASDQDGLIIDAGGYIGTAAIALSTLFPTRPLFLSNLHRTITQFCSRT